MIAKAHEKQLRLYRFTLTLACAGLLATAAFVHRSLAANGGGEEEQVKQAQAPSIDESRKNAITRAVEKVSPAVVGINVVEVREVREYVDPFFSYFFGDRVYRENVQGLGSGWIISPDGYIITNDHVAGNAVKIEVMMTDGTKLPAKLIGSDPVTDIALIKINADKDLPSIPLGNSNDVIVGEWSIAFGNPFGLFNVSAKPTVTVGVISATHVNLDMREGKVYRNMLQTDAAINSGNSGGPLVNSSGEVIGVNTVIYTPNQGSVGLGFAVPINRVKEIVDILKAQGEVERRFNPGVRVQAVNNAIARAYKLDKAEGVIITDIDPKGSASDAGLEVADVIVGVNSEPVLSIDNLQGIIRYSKRGDELQLDILRQGKKQKATLELK